MTTTDAPAPTTSPAEFVLVDGDGREVHRYTQKGAANRRAKTVRGARVLAVEEWDAEQDAARADADVEYINAAGEWDTAPADASGLVGDDDSDAAWGGPDEVVAPAEDDAESMDTMAATDDGPERTLNDLDVVAAFLAAMADQREDDFPQSETVVIHWPVRDVDEMTGTDWPEVGRRIKDTDRAARYAAESAVGPAVEIMRDGAWVETRRYVNAGFAARAARGIATRQKRAQEHARVVATDGTVLLDTDTDELTVQARIDGVVLTGVRPL